MDICSMAPRRWVFAFRRAPLGLVLVVANDPIVADVIRLTYVPA
jgi:hypothetical protein